MAHDISSTIICKACYRGGTYGKRVPFPHGRATVIGDERQQDEPLAGIPLGRCWLVGRSVSQETALYSIDEVSFAG